MIRRVISTAALASAMVAVPLVAAAPAQSIPVCKSGYQCSRTYYSDNTYDDVVGGYTRFCDGTSNSWGETTPYQTTSQSPCPDW
jgi:hypothetical protein